MVTRLAELDPAFLRIIDERSWQRTQDLASADGIIMLCPKCLNLKGGRRGVHSVICWRPKVPMSFQPGPGRWEFRGTGMSDLTLFANSSSILLTGRGCGAHFFVRDGKIEMC